MHFASMTAVANIQIRDVPDDVHRELKSQAALAGQSLNEFLLARMTETSCSAARRQCSGDWPK